MATEQETAHAVAKVAYRTTAEYLGIPPESIEEDGARELISAITEAVVDSGALLDLECPECARRSHLSDTVYLIRQRTGCDLKDAVDGYKIAEGDLPVALAYVRRLQAVRENRVYEYDDETEEVG